MRSRSEKAKPFRQWVVNEVLPSIRKLNVPIAERDRFLPQVKEPTNLQSFNYQGNSLDYGLLNGEPIFNLNAVAGLLGIINPRMSIDTTNSNYVVKIDNSIVSFAYNRKLHNTGELFLTEAGLYMFLMRSNNPNAEPFQLWVTKEVLPTIRKTGSYSLQPQIPKSYGEALLEAGRLALEKEKLEAQIKADKPLVEFAKDVSQSSNAISVGEFAKLLNTQGIKLGQNKLFAWLRENGYLMHDNEPYQKFVDCGYFATIEQVYQTFNSKQTTLKTLITGKGQIYFHKKLSAVFKLKTQITKA